MIWMQATAALLALGAVVVSCSEGTDGLRIVKDGDSIVQGTGTVRFLEVEGGCWGIRADEGRNLEPVDLPDGFRQDGLRVRFVAKAVPLVSACMIGSIVEILEIEPL
jgi:hypothetical protein